MEGYCTLRETAQVLGIKVRTIREWIRKGKIKAEKNNYKHSNYWYISESEISRIKRGE